MTTTIEEKAEDIVRTINRKHGYVGSQRAYMLGRMKEFESEIRKDQVNKYVDAINGFKADIIDDIYPEKNDKSLRECLVEVIQNTIEDK